MNPDLVLNEDEKKERFRKHLEKKDKLKTTENEGPFFNPYGRNVEFFHQQVIFNTPFQNPMFWNFDEPNTFNFDFNRARTQSASDVYDNSLNAQETAAPTDIVEPFVFFEENTEIQIDENLASESSFHYEDFKTPKINPENMLPFPIQRSLLETNLNYAERIENENLLTKEIITNS